MQNHAIRVAAALTLLAACSSSGGSSDSPSIHEETCQISDTTNAPDFVEHIGCKADFDALASVPLDATIPGARSTKVVLDQLDTEYENQLYFQNSTRFKIHWDFASTHLSGKGPKGQILPTVTGIADFSSTEYY